jgi:hypothetical protein
MCSRRLFRQRHDQKCYIRQPFAVGDRKGWRSAVLKAVRLPRVPPATPMRWRDADRDSRMSRIDRRFNVPVNAVLAVAVFNVLFGLLYLARRSRLTLISQAAPSFSIARTPVRSLYSSFGVGTRSCSRGQTSHSAASEDTCSTTFL